MANAILIQNTGSTQVFAHPDDITHTATLKRRLTDKLVGGQRFPHVRVEYVINRQAEIRLCDSSCAGSENLSVRLAISGSPRNAAEVEKLLDELKSHIDQMKQDHVAKGFPLTEITFDS